MSRIAASHPNYTPHLSLAVALLFCAPGPLHALPEDTSQPVELEANRADIDDRNGVSVYQGKVIYNQGSIRMEADRMTLYTPDGIMERVVLEGKPAHYGWQPEPGAKRVEAAGDQIEYDAANDRVVVTGNGVIDQGGDTFRGGRIVYDMAHDRVQADGGDKKDSRVKITFQPRSR